MESHNNGEISVLATVVQSATTASYKSFIIWVPTSLSNTERRVRLEIRSVLT